MPSHLPNVATKPPKYKGNAKNVLYLATKECIIPYLYGKVALELSHQQHSLHPLACSISKKVILSLLQKIHYLQFPRNIGNKQDQQETKFSSEYLDVWKE